MIFCEKNGEKFAETENVRIFAPVKKIWPRSSTE